MWRMATIVRPLRSKRATISPVRPRAKASGLTRMSVLSMESFQSLEPGTGSGGCPRRGLGRHGRLVRRGPPPAALRGGRRCAGLRLAVGAQLPRRVDGLAAREAGVLELAHAARTPQVVALDLVVAVRAQLVVQVREPRLGGRHLQLAEADVVEVLRRAHDPVDDRPPEGGQGGG